MANMWMVRSGPNSSLINKFLDLNLVAIGWNLGDLKNKSSDEIENLFENKYGDTSSANQVEKFVNDINIGDYVITNDSENKTYFLGRITSNYYYSEELKLFDSSDDLYSDIRNVEWLCEIPSDSFKKSTKKTLKSSNIVYNINEVAKNEILNIFNEIYEIKEIRTLTLSNKDPVSLTYEMVVDFLSNILINDRNGYFHYHRRNIVLIGRTLVLFKYGGKIIGKGIIYDEVDEGGISNGIEYNGSYLFETDSIGVFVNQIDLNELQEYVPDIKTLTRDQKIDIKYLDKINLMIEKHLTYDKINQYELPAKVIRNYLDEKNLGCFEQPILEEGLISFKEQFSPEILEKLEGIDIINKIFSHDKDKTTLCYYLEYSKELLMGSIAGYSAHKYSLFKNDNGQWIAGSSRKHEIISEEEAIEYGSKIRDAIVNGAKLIENTNLESINDYINLENDLNKIFSDCDVNPTRNWIHKYYVLIFPEKFPLVHTDDKKEETLRKFRIKPENGYYEKDWQFYKLAKKANIKLYSLFDENILKLFFDSEDIWDSIEKGKLIDLRSYNLKNNKVNFQPFESDEKRNLIYFGAPGTGKSFNLNMDKDNLLENHGKNYERVTFHPDYSYANFVGTYKPVPEKNDSITYKYVPGPFMRCLVKAYKKPQEPHILIIEEINRANVAAVFGDVFQLLDRKDNVSEYPIQTSEDMKTFLEDEFKSCDSLNDYDSISIPQNMFIWATMNSADQGVFHMDTAFKRRWDFKYFGINEGENDIKDTKFIFNDEMIYWNHLRKAINDELLSYKLNEDKLMGPFFAFNEFKNQEIPIDTFKDIFKNKIIMYLFEDAARSKRNDLFSGAKTKDYVTYSEICEKFDKIGIGIFCDNIKSKFISDDE